MEIKTRRRMKRRLLTTGEAVKKLKGVISRSTVSRYLDRGILRGKKNPVTGERHISLVSLRSFMKKYDLK